MAGSSRWIPDLIAVQMYSNTIDRALSRDDGLSDSG
jgi:hypothetical protein